MTTWNYRVQLPNLCGLTWFGRLTSTILGCSWTRKKHHLLEVKLIKPWTFLVLWGNRYLEARFVRMCILLNDCHSMFLFPGRRRDCYSAGMLFSSRTTGRPFPFMLLLSKLKLLSSISRRKLHTDLFWSSKASSKCSIWRMEGQRLGEYAIYVYYDITTITIACILGFIFFF